MSTIQLKESIQLFGLKDGLDFYLRWIAGDIKTLYYDFIKKGWCREHAYNCPSGCRLRKIYSQQYLRRVIRKVIKTEDERFSKWIDSEGGV